ncbi:MAG: Fibronectin type domain protein, partial [Thermoleophilia bacterium]|nr:Fibronectin type domain protein [Thermoleophilia bacterium]
MCGRPRAYGRAAARVGERPRGRVLAAAACWLLLLALLPAAAGATSFYEVTGFESGTLSPNGGGIAASTGGGVGIVTAPVRHGTYALHADATSASGASAKFAAGGSRMVGRLGFRIAQLPTSGGQSIFDTHTATGNANTRPFRLTLDAAGVLTMQSVGTGGTGVDTASGATITANTWHYVDVDVNIATTTWTVAWRVDGAVQPPLSGTSPAASTFLDAQLGTTATTYDYIADYDDFVLSSAAADYPIGDGQVVGMRPVATGTHSVAATGDYATSTNNGGVWTSIVAAADQLSSPGSAALLDDWPIAPTGSPDLVRQTAGVTDFLEYRLGPHRVNGAPRAVSVLGAFREATNSPTANSVDVDARSGASTAPVFTGNPGGSTGTVNYFSGVLNTAPGGAAWTHGRLSGLVLQLGSADPSPAVWTDGLQVEADFPIAAGADVTAPTNPATAAIYDVDVTATADRDGSNDGTNLTASWGVGADGGSGVRDYDWCFSTVSTGCTAIPGTGTVGFGNTTRQAAAVATPTLASGTIVYSCVRTYDNAGNPAAAWACSDGFQIDTAAPTNPTQANIFDLDTTWTLDDDWTSSTTSLSVSWNAGSDGAGSGVADYDVCFSTVSTGCTNIAGTTTQTGNTSRTTTATATAMTNGTMYYACVRTRDAASNVAPWQCSDGFRVDTTVPVNPTQANEFDLDTTWTLDRDTTTSATALSASWNAGSDGAGSGVASYDVCFSSSGTGCTNIPGTSTQSGNTTRTAVAVATGMTNGGMYFTCVRTVDVAGNVAGWQCSDGFVVDTAAPTNPTAANVFDLDTTWTLDRDATSNTTALSVSWNPGTDGTGTGVSNYDVCFSTVNSGCTNIAGTTTQTGNTTRTATAIATGMVNGTTYYSCVRTHDVAGNVAGWGCSDGFLVDTTAPTNPTAANVFDLDTTWTLDRDATSSTTALSAS